MPDTWLSAQLWQTSLQAGKGQQSPRRAWCVQTKENCILEEAPRQRMAYLTGIRLHHQTAEWCMHVQEKLYLEGPLPESLRKGGACRQNRLYPGRKQIRRGQLHSLPALIQSS